MCARGCLDDDDGGRGMNVGRKSYRYGKNHVWYHMCIGGSGRHVTRFITDSFVMQLMNEMFRKRKRLYSRDIRVINL